jgi:hypothetical protein
MSCSKSKLLFVCASLVFCCVNSFAQTGGSISVSNPITKTAKGFSALLSYCETREAFSLLDRQRELVQEDLQKTTGLRDALVRIREAQSGSISSSDAGAIAKLSAKVSQLASKVQVMSTILNTAMSPDPEQPKHRRIRPSVFSVYDMNQDGAIDQSDIDQWGACYFSHPTDFAHVPSCKGSVNGIPVNADFSGDGVLSLSDLSLMAAAKACYETNFPVYNPSLPTN